MATRDFNKIQPPALRDFFLKGMAYLKAKQDDAFAISAGEPEFIAWAEYFERVVGAMPYHFKHCRADPNLSFTAPTRWPQWFDARAVPDRAA